jgi:hypothetical protein
VTVSKQPQDRIVAKPWASRNEALFTGTCPILEKYSPAPPEKYFPASTDFFTVAAPPARVANEAVPQLQPDVIFFS